MSVSKERYDELVEIYEFIQFSINPIIIATLKEVGVKAKVSSRIKDFNSLRNKIADKQISDANYSVQSIGDMLGFRIIFGIKSQKEQFINLYKLKYKKYIIAFEEKEKFLDTDQFGYLSDHFDMQFEVEDKCYRYELQLRTIAQDTWAEFSHSFGGYKKSEMPRHITRQISALAALFEIADNQFQIIEDLLKLEDIGLYTDLIRYIERLFIKNTDFPEDYNRETTVKFFVHAEALGLSEEKLPDIMNHIENNAINVSASISYHENNPFCTQPEIFIIEECLVNRNHKIITLFEEIYTLDELEDLALILGHPLEI